MKSLIIKLSIVVFIILLLLKIIRVMPVVDWSWWEIVFPLMVGFGLAGCILFCQLILLIMIDFIAEARKR